MLHEKPPGPMHDALRRAIDELKTHNNPYGCINYVTNVLTNSEKLKLPSGVDYATVPTPDNTTTTGSGTNGNNTSRVGVSDAGTLATSGAWMGAGVGAIEFQGATGMMRGPLPNDRANTRVLSGSPADGAPALPPTGNDAAAATETVPHYKLNATEVMRLLLIRAEAFGMTKQHEKALVDGKNALEVSHGQSPEAHFCIGREQRRLFHIPEAVDAFDMGEALLRSIQQSLRNDTREAFDAGVKETMTDNDFWAQRGYTLEEAASLGISRGEFELQEQAAIQRQGAATSRLPTGSLVVPGSPGAKRKTFASAMADADDGVEDGGRLTGAVGDENGNAPSSNGSWANQPVGGGGGGLSSTMLEDLLFLRTGISASELAMWRRLSNEAHALLAMRTSHTVPISVHYTSLTMLDRTLNGVRGGLTLSIENSTNSAMRFIAASAPDAQYFKTFSFPEIIPKGHCGIAMLFPRGWGGFSGCVCYELMDATYPVSLMLTFENPMMGSAKFGLRFIENAFPFDLRKAFADLNGGSTQGIQGATANSHVPNTAVTEKGATPATATIRGASRANAQKAVRMPPSGVWVTSHKVTFGARSAKANAYTVSPQSICATVCEMQRVKMRSVELLGALEYAGPHTLKKISAVSRRYRELVNNLPPPMFYGSGRRAYPDYTLLSDREASPWVVHSQEAVTWRIVFEGRILEREELSVVCDIDGQTTSRPILTISVESHARVASQFYYGDKRSPQLTLKESWMPFSSSMYLATPMGRTFGTCTNDNQGQFTLAVGGANPSKADEPLYTARKKAPDATRTSVLTNVVPSSSYVDPYLAGSSSAAALGGTAAGSHAAVTTAVSGGGPSGGVVKRGPASTGLSMSPLAFMADKGNGSMMLQSQRAAAASSPSPSTATSGGAGGHAGAGLKPSAAGAGESSTSLSSLGSGGVGGKGLGRGANSLAHLARGDHYTLWRSQHVSGAAVPNSPARHTNQGAQIVAEVRVAPQGMHALTRGYTLAELRLLPGADALLASVMTFCIARW